MDSILTSIKNLLGIAEEYTQFDQAIIMHINSVFLTLVELGVIPKTGYSITDADDVWSDIIPNDDTLLNTVKSYMYLKVKMLFDPSLTTSVTELEKEQIQEFEWRLNAYVESESSYD